MAEEDERAKAAEAEGLVRYVMAKAELEGPAAPGEELRKHLRGVGSVVKAQAEDAASEARKWIEALVRTLVLLNAGAAVAVLSFVGTGKLSSYRSSVWALVFFALGAIVAQLAGLWGLHVALRRHEQLGSIHKDLVRDKVRNPSDLFGLRGLPGHLSKLPVIIFGAAMACFVAGVVIGLVSLWHEGAGGAAVQALPYLGGS